jgi:hypothetical protein
MTTRNLLILCLCIILSNTSQAQFFSQNFDYSDATFEIDGTSKKLSLTDSGGNLVSVVKSKLNGTNDEDILVIKLDNSGNLIFQTNYGSQLPDNPQAIMQTDNGYLVTGTAGDPSTSFVFALEIDFNGGLLWSKIYPYSVNQNAEAVALTQVVGSTNPEYLILGKRGNGNSAVLLRIDQNGSLISRHEYKMSSSNEYNNPNHIIYNPNNNTYLIVGDTKTKQGAGYYKYRLFLLEIDANLKVVQNTVTNVAYGTTTGGVLKYELHHVIGDNVPLEPQILIMNTGYAIHYNTYALPSFRLFQEQAIYSSILRLNNSFEPTWNQIYGIPEFKQCQALSAIKLPGDEFGLYLQCDQNNSSPDGAMSNYIKLNTFGIPQNITQYKELRFHSDVTGTMNNINNSEFFMVSPADQNIRFTRADAMNGQATGCETAWGIANSYIQMYVKASFMGDALIQKKEFSGIFNKNPNYNYVKLDCVGEEIALVRNFGNGAVSVEGNLEVTKSEDSEKVSFNIKSETNKTVILRHYDLLGRMISSKTVNIVEGENYLDVLRNSLQSGVNIISIQLEDKFETFKIIK